MYDLREVQLISSKINQMNLNSCITPAQKSFMTGLKIHKKHNNTFLQKTLSQGNFQFFRTDDHSNTFQTSRSRIQRRTPKNIQYKFQISNVDDQELYQEGMKQLRDSQTVSLLPSSLKYQTNSQSFLTLMPNLCLNYQAPGLRRIKKKQNYFSDQEFLKDQELINIGKLMLEKNPLLIQSPKESQYITTPLKSHQLHESFRQSVSHRISIKELSQNKTVSINNNLINLENPQNLKSKILIQYDKLSSVSVSENKKQRIKTLPHTPSQILQDLQRCNINKRQFNQKKLNLYKSQHSNFILARDIQSQKKRERAFLDV